MTAVEVLATTIIAGDPEQVPKIRSWVRELLRLHCSCVDDVELCVSETVTNSIVHTDSQTIKIAVFTDDQAIRVEVTDEGASESSPYVYGNPDGLHEHGRGMVLVNAITNQRWGTLAADTGRITWFMVKPR